ncbi:MFS transporter [Heliorestis acidaminivorans]|uniref:MFS transporter n=1 Tax=Heliorestis acidaminivorans TaxID=553427 RepID=UPI0014788128|nr:MFS transporter [Heliorestis acidaminivorans]
MQWRDKLDKRNFIFLTANGALYFSALAFFDANVLIPLFLNGLTDSPLLVGLAAAIRSIGFFLPQILIAGWVAGAQNLNLFQSRLHLFTRSLLILPVLAIWFGLSPTVIVVTFFVTFTVFAFGEGMGQVSWMDIYSRTIDESHRGKLLGTMQALGGLGALGGAFVVQRVLSSPDFAFPYNFALLFFLALFLLWASIFAIRMTQDPPKKDAKERKVSARYVVTHVPKYLQDHPSFSKMLIVQVLMGFNIIGFPFYILYVQQTGSLPAWLIGFIVMFQIIGQVIGGLLWGYLSDKAGNKRTIMATLATNIIVPLLILLSGQVTGLISIIVTLLGFMTLGMVLGGWLGFVNYLMETTAEEKRPIYVSISNLFATPVALLPLVAGAFLKVIPMPWLFISIAIIQVLALFLAFRLPDPRDEKKQGLPFLFRQPAPARRTKE